MSSPRGQPQECENGGRNVQQVFAPCMSVSLRRRGPWARRMPCSRCSMAGPAGCVGKLLTSHGSGWKVVGDDENRGVFIGVLKQMAEHHVVEDITRCHNVLVNFVIRLRNPIDFWWVIAHETVTEVVDAIEIDRHEVPRLILNEMHRAGLDGGTLCDDLGAAIQTSIRALVDSLARKKGAEFITGNVLGMDPQVGELISRGG